MDEPQGDGTPENRRRGTGKRGSTNHFVEVGAISDVLAPSSTPCGACKFLRRKCIHGCIFAPHFSSDQGAARFAAVHKVFGASNVSKLLLHIPTNRRHDAVVTICYEAQARLSDPIYGCVSTIVALQQQVQSLQGELSAVQNQLINSRFAVASALQNSQHFETLQPAYSNTSSVSHSFINMNNFSPNFGENTIAHNSNNFEPNIHNLSHHVQDEEEEESHDNLAVAFVNHIFH